MEYQNKTVIITGGASGMGFLAGKCYAAEGANIVLADINKETLDEKVAEINSAGGGKAIGCVCDVRVYEQVCAVRNAAIKEFGSIDILICCAGGAEARMCNCQREFKDMPIEVYDWGIDVNLKGPFYFTHACIGQMLEQKSGVIILLGSVTGEEGGATNAAYSASKCALMGGFTKAIAKYGAPHGVRVCCVSPGPVLTRAAMANMKTPMGRAADPQEVVDLFMFLTSSKASFITGTNYFIDGGRNIGDRNG